MLEIPRAGPGANISQVLALTACCSPTGDPCFPAFSCLSAWHALGTAATSQEHFKMLFAAGKVVKLVSVPVHVMCDIPSVLLRAHGSKLRNGQQHRPLQTARLSRAFCPRTHPKDGSRCLPSSLPPEQSTPRRDRSEPEPLGAGGVPALEVSCAGAEPRAGPLGQARGRGVALATRTSFESHSLSTRTNCGVQGSPGEEKPPSPSTDDHNTN